MSNSCHHAGQGAAEYQVVSERRAKHLPISDEAVPQGFCVLFTGSLLQHLQFIQLTEMEHMLQQSHTGAAVGLLEPAAAGNSTSLLGYFYLWKGLDVTGGECNLPRSMSTKHNMLKQFGCENLCPFS